MERLILFDIDGTLTRTQNGYLPFNEAILKTFDFAGDIRTVVPDGNTDPLIVMDIFTKSGVEIAVGPEQWQQFTSQLASSYRDHVARGATTVRPLPGADALLQQLDGAADFHSSVVTGNFEATAQVKLAAAGLTDYLARGAYASDSDHRPDLPAIARERWQVATGRSIAAATMCHRRRYAQRFAVRPRQRHEMRACRHRPLSGRRAGVLAARWLSGGPERHASGGGAVGEIVNNFRR